MTVKEQAQISAARLVTSQDWLAVVAYMELQSIDAVADFSLINLFAPDALQKTEEYQKEVYARLSFLAEVNQLADEHRNKQKQEDIE